MNKLPESYKKIYKSLYLNYAHSNSIIRKLASIIERWYHRKAAIIDVKGNLLEVGCGALNHMKYEKDYINYDVVEPKKFLFDSSDDNSKKRIRKFYRNINQIPLDIKYEKIISIAVLEHVTDLDELLEKISMHMEVDGNFIVEVPAEGEFLWWLSWRLTTGLFFWLRYKLDYGVIMRYEHVNNFEKIYKSLKKYFRIKKIESFPFNLKNFRIYVHIECKKLKI